jgi:class 3 adenylate cyclase
MAECLVAPIAKHRHGLKIRAQRCPAHERRDRRARQGPRPQDRHPQGPCLAVVLNERQDYFGQTVNIASRVQSVAESRAIFVTQSVVAQSAKVLEAHGL